MARRRKSYRDIDRQFDRMVWDYPARMMTQDRFNRIADARDRYLSNIQETRTYQNATERVRRQDQRYIEAAGRGDANAMRRAEEQAQRAYRTRDGRRYNRSTYMGLNQG